MISELKYQLRSMNLEKAFRKMRNSAWPPKLEEHQSPLALISLRVVTELQKKISKESLKSP